ncbi:MAG: hypothetical protein IPJ46_12760 [Anaerolineales bacterium]|nr:hypothetical protein [Anaerolineales bacterium]
MTSSNTKSGTCVAQPADRLSGIDYLNAVFIPAQAAFDCFCDNGIIFNN